MKRPSVYLMLAAVAVLVFAPCIHAGGCRTFVHREVVVEKPVIKAIAAIEFVTPVLPVYTVPPAYGAQYYPPQAYGGYPAGGGATAGIDPCAELKARYQLMEQRLQRLEGGGSGPPPLRTAPSPMNKAGNGDEATAPTGEGFLAFASQNCASCHDEASKGKGNGFVLLQGGRVANLTPEQSGEVMRRMLLPAGHPRAMPPKNALSVERRAAGALKFVEGDGEDSNKKK